MWAWQLLKVEMASKEKGEKLSEAITATPFDVETCGAQAYISMASRWSVANLKWIGQNLWAELTFLCKKSHFLLPPGGALSKVGY